MSSSNEGEDKFEKNCLDRDLIFCDFGKCSVSLFQTDMPLYRKSIVRETKSTIPKVVSKRGGVNKCM